MAASKDGGAGCTEVGEKVSVGGLGVSCLMLAGAGDGEGGAGEAMVATGANTSGPGSSRLGTSWFSSQRDAWGGDIEQVGILELRLKLVDVGMEEFFLF